MRSGSLGTRKEAAARAGSEPERVPLPLLLQSRLTLFIGLQGTEGPTARLRKAWAARLWSSAISARACCGILARREGLRQLLKRWNKRIHTKSLQQNTIPSLILRLADQNR